MSSGGDGTILPVLFDFAQKNRLPLFLDRDRRPSPTRVIRTRGHSDNTYGSWIYTAPSYPLFGRWHIDATNSFVYKESELEGVIELARQSRIPVQKLARSSTGAALTAIETRVALDMGYLVPWQKSAAESPRSVYHLLQVDKGGLVFVPDNRDSPVHTGVYQIDFSQMYPTIMDIHNISPETINCSCCRNLSRVLPVPETGYHICQKRRGVVSAALHHILQRRAYYKKKLKENLPGEQSLQEKFEARQNSIKWMLVTSFGYLGYRNAKFGRLESHESVTAFGREKILTAMELAEDANFRVLHAITDCLFIQSETPVDPEMEETRIRELCREIQKATGIAIETDGRYDWVVFLSSRNNPDLPVMNRYFGRFADGTMKRRGLACRRKDTPPFIASLQERMLEILSICRDATGLPDLHPRMDELYREMLENLREGKIPWQEALIRKTVGRKREDYLVENDAKQSLDRLAEREMEVSPGEKIRFLRLKTDNRKERTLTEEEAFDLDFDNRKPTLDPESYQKLLIEAYREIWENFAPVGYFETLKDDQFRLKI